MGYGESNPYNIIKRFDLTPPSVESSEYFSEKKVSGEMRKDVLNFIVLLVVAIQTLLVFILKIPFNILICFVLCAIVASVYKLVFEFKGLKAAYIIYAIMFAGSIRMMLDGSLDSFVVDAGYDMEVEKEKYMAFAYVILAFNLIWANIIKYFIVFLKPSSSGLAR